MKKEHKIKTLPEFFEMALTGRKPFEIRINDRDYKEGDIIKLCEIANNDNEFKFTGNEIMGYITDVIPLDKNEQGWVVLKYNVLAVTGSKETLEKGKAILKDERKEPTEGEKLSVYVVDEKGKVVFNGPAKIFAGVIAKETGGATLFLGHGDMMETIKIALKLTELSDKIVDQIEKSVEVEK